MTLKILTLAVAALAASLTSAAQLPQADYDVVPAPLDIQLRPGAPFTLTPSTAVCVAGEGLDFETAMLRDLLPQAQVSTLPPRQKKLPIGAVVLRLKPGYGSEEYSLSVTAHNIVIEASAPAGIFYGIGTLSKAIAPHYGQSVSLPQVAIADKPRFAYRGMLLDCSRHFFSVAEVKEFLDMIALHNCNRFHWHLTDDQGWRLEVPALPRLTSVAAWRESTVQGCNSDIYDGQRYGGFYTEAQVRDIVDYAAQRHIEVIPEVDMPGHMKALLAAYPELGCTGGPYTVGRQWGIFNDVLCVGNPRVVQTMKTVIDELVSLFPSEYIHIGGDETPTVRWEHCPKCQAVKLSQGETLQGRFTHQIVEYLKQKGRRAIGWDEILGQGIPPETTIMAWRGMDAAVSAARAGHDVILTPTSNCYFDYCQTADRGHEPTLCGGMLDVKTVYNFEALPDTLSPEARAHILGVQANVWTEYIPNFATVEYMTLPRLAALSEVQWAAPARQGWEAFRSRLDRLTPIYQCRHWQYARHLWPDPNPERRWMVDE